MEKTILITGCSSGIGLSTCYYLKARGYRVFATARKSEDVTRLQAEGFEALQLDVGNRQQIQEVVTKVLSLTDGTLYGLCNNAGYAQPGALEDIDHSSFQQQFDTNVFGLQALTNAVIPTMRKQGYGRIIHISSVLGFVALPFRGAYTASKYAVEGLADTLRLELRHSGIFVSLIEPGPINTHFRDSALAAYHENISPQQSHFVNYYVSFLKNFEASRQTLQFGAEPEAVAKKIYHALESRRPKIRYHVTIVTHVMAILKRLLPQRLLDLILAHVAKQEMHS